MLNPPKFFLILILAVECKCLEGFDWDRQPLEGTEFS